MATPVGVGDSISIPFVRTKRAHRKSRNGCITCKQRRVKCDEEHPVCTKCTLRGVQCVYADRNAKSSNTTTSPGSSNLQSPLPRENEENSPSQGSTTSSNVPSDLSLPPPELDAELARYYLEFVAQTFAGSSTRQVQHWVWKCFIPSLALAYPTIRNGMLALGAIALHFSRQLAIQQLEPLSQPLTSSIYIDAAQAHGELFVNQSRQELDALDPTNVDSNTASTRLLAVLSFAWFRHYRQEGLAITSPQAWTWIHLIRGVRIVHTSMFQSGQNLHHMIQEDMKPEVTSINGEPTALSPTSSENVQEMLTFINNTKSERFELLLASIDNGTFSFNSSQQRMATLAAINSLAQITDHVCAWSEMHSLFRALCTWPGSLPDDFVWMLAQCDLTALAIYSHWLMLVALAEDLWWVGGMGKAGIREVIALMPETSVGLQTIIDRPRQLLAFSPSDWD